MRRLTSPGWLACHALAAVLVTAFAGLGWWQIGRATGGNTLSWAYAFEWPLFAGFVAFIWVREVRRARGLTGAPHDTETTAASAATPDASGFRRPVLTTRRSPANGDTGDTSDTQLAAYNNYLGWLSAHPGARPTDYPGDRLGEDDKQAR
jgi:hypothetical protein